MIYVWLGISGDCGKRVLEGSAGQFVSHVSWPAPYPDDINCVYEVTCAPGETVVLNFQSFEFGPGPDNNGNCDR